MFELLKDRQIDEEQQQTLLATAAAVLGGVLMRRVVHGLWSATHRGKPPVNPADREVGWLDALLFAGLTGLAVGLTRVIARRGAAAAWQRLRHRGE